MTRRGMTRRTGLAVAIGGALLIAAAVALVWFLFARPADGADDTARRYLTALSDGDADTVAALQSADLDADARAVVADALAGASELPADGRVDEVRDAGDGDAVVRASVELAGERRSMQFGMTIEAGEWRIDADGLAAVTLTTTLGDAVRVGDALVPVTPAPVLLAPAVYPVVAAPRAVVTGSAEVVALAGGAVTAGVDASVSPDAAAAVGAQLEEYEDACTRPASDVPLNCGLRVPWAADLAVLDALAFRIDRRPVLEIAPDARSFAARGGVVVATATGTTPEGASASFTYRAEDWALRGSVRLSGDSLTLAVE